jgi:hypothetical protein
LANVQRRATTLLGAERAKAQSMINSVVGSSDWFDSFSLCMLKNQSENLQDGVIMTSFV